MTAPPIPLANETKISLAQAAKLFGESLDATPPHPSCIGRWTITGYKGLRLESVRLGKRRMTTAEAVLRFIAAMQEMDEAGFARSSPVDKPAPAKRSRRRDHAAAEVRAARLMA